MGVPGPFDAYKGVPREQLRIDAIVWTGEAANHVRTRSLRQPGDFDIEPEWATEAALDPRRVARISGDTEETRSLRLVGHSPAAPPSGRLLKVWIWSDNPEESADWNGGSAALANPTDVRRYEEGV